MKKSEISMTAMLRFLLASLRVSSQLAKTTQIFDVVDIIITLKRSLGQGNVFIPVCQSFCSKGGLHQGLGVSVWVQWGICPGLQGLCLGPCSLHPGSGRVPVGLRVCKVIHLHIQPN